jgi:hypothetical protein
MSLKRAGVLIVGVFISFRLFTWALIGNCTALAPDEQGYVDMFNYVQNPEGPRPVLQWPNTPIVVLKILFLPASIFHSLGLSDLTAFRAQSVTLTLFVVFFLLKAVKVLGIRERFDSLSQSGKKKFVIFWLAAICTPTVIIWSVLGLREVFLYFSLSLLFLSAANIFSKSESSYYFWLIAFAISLVILGNTKFYIYVIILVSIFIVLILNFVNKANLVKTLSVLLVTLSTLVPFTQQLSEINLPQIRFSSFDFSFNFMNSLATPRLPSTTYSELQSCDRNKTAGPLLHAALVVVNNLAPNRVKDVLVQPAVDAPAATALRADDSLRSTLNLLELPTGLLYFLFFPLSVVSSGIFGVLGVIEIIFWLPLYTTFAVMLFRSRSKIRKDAFVCLLTVFTVIFTLFSALAEVNFGTAIRHRSLLLIPMVLLASYLWTEKKKPANSPDA